MSFVREILSLSYGAPPLRPGSRFPKRLFRPEARALLDLWRQAYCGPGVDGCSPSRLLNLDASSVISTAINRLTCDRFRGRQRTFVRYAEPHRGANPALLWRIHRRSRGEQPANCAIGNHSRVELSRNALRQPCGPAPVFVSFDSERGAIAGRIVTFPAPTNVSRMALRSSDGCHSRATPAKLSLATIGMVGFFFSRTRGRWSDLRRCVGLAKLVS